MPLSPPPSDCHYTELPGRQETLLDFSATEALRARVDEGKHVRARVAGAVMSRLCRLPLL